MDDRTHANIDVHEDAFVGARLAGRYRLEKVLGRGGMGVVYEAVQEDLGRRVAIKLISGSVSAAGLARLRLEAEATARMGNPHIVQVTDFQSNPGEPPFLVMELLGGRSLRALLRAEGVIGWQRAARFGCQILEALSAAHAAHIVHRDIKPDNVFVLTSAAVPDMIKVLDFGVAKLVADDARGVTAAGALIGTLAYMSPEAASGYPVDARADLYAVAVSLYEAVAGTRPIVANDTAALLAAIVASEPVPLQRFCPHVPDAFAAVLMRALRKSPEERFELASEMATALAACLGPSGEEPARTALGGYRSDATGATQATQPTQASQAEEVAAAPHAARAASVALPPTVVEQPGATANLAPARAGQPPVGAAAPPPVPASWPAWPAGSQSPFDRPSFGRTSTATSGPSLPALGSPGPRAKLARDLDAASTWSLVWAAVGLFSFLFPAAIVGIVLGVRAYRLGRQLQSAVPLRATVGIVTGIIGCLASVVALLAVAVLTFGYFVDEAQQTQIAALQKKVGERAGAAVLDREAACAMAEIHVLAKGHDGHHSSSIESFRCSGTLTQSKERAQLEAVSFSAVSDKYSLNACFIKGATWSVSEVRKDACPIPPTPVPAAK